jgi:thiosulfate reductase cytochrome b subunit
VPRATGSVSPEERLAMCAACHDDSQRMTPKKVDDHACPSYRASLHYAALRFGGAHAPVCEDCHDTHGVHSSRDTSATTAAGHRRDTCAQKGCHTGASERFAATGMSHPEMRQAHSAALTAESRALEWLGGGVLGLLALCVLLEAQRRWLGRRPAAAPRIDGALVPRLSLAVRLQHGALLASFTLLALTGLPLRFPDAPTSALIERLLGGFDTARVIHRASAVVMALTALAHLAGVLGALVRARYDARAAWPMLPVARDFSDAWETLRYWLRLRPAPPPYERHHWREKVHYWAVLWGVPVMIGTGLVLWFGERLADELPRGALIAAALAHGDEALLAVAIVLVWHLWVVHVSPGRAHRWGTFLDGKITREYWLTRHTLAAGRETKRPGAPKRTGPPPPA